MAITPDDEYRKAFKLISFFDSKKREYEKEKKVLDESILKLVNDRDNERELSKKEQSDNEVVKYYEKHLTMARTHVKTVAESVEQLEEELRLKQELAQLLAQRLAFCKERKDSIRARCEELTKELPNLVHSQKPNITWETDTALPQILLACVAQGHAPGFAPIPLLSPEFETPARVRNRKGQILASVTPKKKSRVSFSGTDGNDNPASTDSNIQASRSTDSDIQLTPQKTNDSAPASNRSTPESVQVVGEYTSNTSAAAKAAKKSPRRQESAGSTPTKKQKKSPRDSSRGRKKSYYFQHPDRIIDQLKTAGTISALRPSEGTSQQPTIETFSRTQQQSEVLRNPTRTSNMAASQIEPIWEGLTPYGPDVDMSPHVPLEQILNPPNSEPRNANDIALVQRQRLHDQEMHALQQMRAHDSNMESANAAAPAYDGYSYQNQQARYHQGDARLTADSNVFQAELTELMTPDEYEQHFPQSNHPPPYHANAPMHMTEQDSTNDAMHNVPLHYEYEDLSDHNAHHNPDQAPRD